MSPLHSQNIFIMTELKRKKVQIYAICLFFHLIPNLCCMCFSLHLSCLDQAVLDGFLSKHCTMELTCPGSDHPSRPSSLNLLCQRRTIFGRNISNEFLLCHLSKDTYFYMSTSSLTLTHTHSKIKTHINYMGIMQTWFCQQCHQQGLICQALLYQNLVGNTSAFRSIQTSPQIPVTHHLTLPLMLNLIFPLTGVAILVVYWSTRPTLINLVQCSTSKVYQYVLIMIIPPTS